MLIGNPDTFVSKDDRIAPVIESCEDASPDDVVIVVNASQSSES